MNQAYLKSINPTFDHPVVQELKDYARLNHVPIITDEGIHFIVQLLHLNKAKKVLEIGTAIGYSAILMALFGRVDVWSIEREKSLFDFAGAQVKKLKLDHQIHLIYGDAKTVDLDTSDFDLIFIDAAKASYIDFFARYEKYLKPGGLIITDNLLFRGQVAHPDNITSKNRRQLVKKIHQFNAFICQHPDYDTYLYDIGDGISLSIKK
jgi:predicted O-methyltransferase YrrM